MAGKTLEEAADRLEREADAHEGVLELFGSWAANGLVRSVHFHPLRS